MQPSLSRSRNEPRYMPDPDRVVLVVLYSQQPFGNSITVCFLHVMIESREGYAFVRDIKWSYLGYTTAARQSHD